MHSIKSSIRLSFLIICATTLTKCFPNSETYLIQGMPPRSRSPQLIPLIPVHSSDSDNDFPIPDQRFFILPYGNNNKKKEENDDQGETDENEETPENNDDHDHDNHDNHDHDHPESDHTELQSDQPRKWPGLKPKKKKCSHSRELQAIDPDSIPRRSGRKPPLLSSPLQRPPTRAVTLKPRVKEFHNGYAVEFIQNTDGYSDGDE